MYEVKNVGLRLSRAIVELECALARARAALENFESLETLSSTPDEIIRRHSVNSGFSYDQIIGPSRRGALVEVRQQAMADVYVQCPELSLVQIGQYFGGKDHTTIYYAVKKLGVHTSQTQQERAFADRRKQAA